ncbi:integron integrase [Desulfotalea psychrophila]|nr:integron integrase [Desulfotalea psychrophila]
MESSREFIPDPELGLLEQVQEVLRYYNYAYRTEQSYCAWIIRFLNFYDSPQEPAQMGITEVEEYLHYLQEHENASTSTQRQALNAISFLFQRVLGIELTAIAPSRSKRHLKLPTVLTQEEVSQLLSQLRGQHLLMAQLLYGCGLGLMECIRLRVKDIVFAEGHVFVNAGKGGYDRTVPLPRLITDQLQAQVSRVIQLHKEDIVEGYGEVYLPQAVAFKYPLAAMDVNWQFLFPASKISSDPRSGKRRRHHVMESGLQKAIKTATSRTNIEKHVTCHTLRHSYATHLLEQGTHLHLLQKLLGHKDVKTTEIYTHLMKKNVHDVQSPLDTLTEEQG